MLKVSEIARPQIATVVLKIDQKNPAKKTFFKANSLSFKLMSIDNEAYLIKAPTNY